MREGGPEEGKKDRGDLEGGRPPAAQGRTSTKTERGIQKFGKDKGN